MGYLPRHSFRIRSPEQLAYTLVGLAYTTGEAASATVGRSDDESAILLRGDPIELRELGARSH